MTDKQISERARAVFGEDAWIMIQRIKDQIIVHNLRDNRRLHFADRDMAKTNEWVTVPDVEWQDANNP